MLADLLSLPFFFLTQIKTENEIKTKVVLPQIVPLHIDFSLNSILML